MVFRKLLTVLLIALVWSSCKKDDPTGGTDLNIQQGKGVFILHEGGFNQLNASLAWLNDTASAIQTGLFQQVNQRLLGDILQSMTIVQDDGYLVLNNSKSIEKINISTIELKDRLLLSQSPRFLHAITPTLAFVSTLFSDELLIVNLDPLHVLDSIDLGHWSEEMITIDGKVWVASSNHDQVYQVDPQSRTVGDSITVGYGASHLAQDVEGHLWVMSIGNFIDIPASIHVVDPASGTTVKSWDFSLNEYPSKIQVYDDQVYYLNGGLNRMSIQDAILPTSPFIAGFGYYGYRIDPRDGRIWLADPLDFQQKGKIDLYQPDGTLIRSYTADVVPSDFGFY